MSYDDDADVSTSLREYIESPAKAKREALKQKLQKEGLKREADKPGADLKNLKLAMLKSQVAGKEDEQTKKDRERKKSPNAAMTKSREDEIVAQKLTADVKASADQMVDQGRQAAESKTQMQQQGDIQSDGG